MHDVIDISCGFTYLCEIFEHAFNNFYISYGEKPSLIILPPKIYNDLQFEYGGNEPLEFMGSDIIIDGDITEDIIVLF